MSKKGKNPEPNLEEFEQGENETSTKNGVQEVWNFFSSMKLGLYILLYLAVLSVIATVFIPVDQATNMPKYDMYGSIFYRLGLGLLCFNLLICSLNRIKLISRSLGMPKLRVTETYLQRLKNSFNVRKKQSLQTSVETIKEAFAARGYRVFTEEADGKVYVAADKGRHGVLGSFVTHIAFIIITVGYIYGNFTGFDTFAEIPEGATVNIARDLQNVKLDEEDNFQLKVNKFWIETREDGSVQDYKSDLSVLDMQGKEVRRETIEVNGPLVYNGVKFYQSSYNQGANTFLTYKFVDANKQEQNGKISEGDVVNLPGTDYSIKVFRYIPDFDPQNPMQSKSDKPNNPAVIYALYKGQEQKEMNYKLFNTAVSFEGNNVTFTGADTETVNATGLSIRKDPGVNIVWLGCALLVLGMFVSVYLQHRKAWAIISEVNGVSIVQVGAVTDKNKLGLEEDLNVVKASLE